MDGARDREVTAFVRAQHGRLLRVAYLLCGDEGRAEDLVQTALAKVVVAWRRLDQNEGVDRYMHRVLVNTFISARRRRWWWERPTSQVAETAGPDAFETVDQRDVLRRALAALPTRQRAVVVLRHYWDMSEAQVAEAMGCPVGTVKSLSWRGLKALREQMRPAASIDRVGEVDHAGR